MLLIDQPLTFTKCLSLSLESASPRANPDINYGLREIIICYCMFINFKKYTILVEDIDNDRLCMSCVEAEV